MNDIIATLERIVEDRRQNPRPDSYTCQLLAGGDALMLKKVGEEAAEVIVAGALEDRSRLVAEIADLFFHLTVVLASRELCWEDVAAELRRRNG